MAEIYKLNFDDIFHLQWFAAEDEGRTEEPTARKKTKAREEGQVARSQEIPQAFILLFCILALSWFGTYQSTQIKNFMYSIFSGGFGHKDIDGRFIQNLIIIISILLLKTAGPILFIALIVGYISNVVQVGFTFSTKQLKFDLKKISINPQKIISKILISKNILYNLIKSFIKLLIIGFIAGYVFINNYEKLINLVRLNLFESISFIWSLIFDITIKTSIFLIILSIFDYWWNYREYIESLKMTKHEVKDEYKQSEGDPLIKAKIREKQRMIAQRRMMKEVPKADVVITNPTHISVAIKYDSTIMAAPIVVAKGEGFIALKIREIAIAAGVPIYEDKPLARALYESVEIGEQIPVSLYKAVAEVLAFVYKLKKKKSYV
ncbi:MAG TPA: flagellar biosynthesis protein FlhB [bacterium]|nr:flagellar biosynthesis protein FlhB [bacterium]HPQ18244.1 flagellar biosynthesis protein FlhB [bacterium]